MFINENFDGGGTLPATLTYTAGLAIDTTQAFSPSNDLYNSAAGAKATYSLTKDPNTGNMYVDCYFKGGGTLFTAGQALRVADNTSLLSGTYTCYEVQYSNTAGTGFVGITIRRWNTGTPTNLATLAVAGNFALNLYYRCRETISDVAGNPQISVAVQRQSDGFWVQPDGTFAVGQATALSVTDSSVSKITGNGFVVTWTAQATMFTDSITSDVATSVTPSQAFAFANKANQPMTATIVGGTFSPNGTLTLTPTGVAGVTTSGLNRISTTQISYNLSCGSATGPLTLTDDQGHTWIQTVQTPTGSAPSPTNFNANTTQAIAISGTNLHFTSTTPSFQVGGLASVTKVSQSIADDNNATVTVLSSTAAGGATTITDPASGVVWTVTVNGEAFAVTPPNICPGMTNVPVSFDSTGSVSPGWNNSTVIVQSGGTGATLGSLVNVSAIKETGLVGAGSVNATLSYTDGVSTAPQTVGTPSLSFSPAALTTSGGTTTVTITATNLPLNLSGVTYSFADGGTGSTDGSTTNTGTYTATVPITPGGIAGTITIGVLVNGVPFVSGTLPVNSTYTWDDYVSLGTGYTGLTLTWKFVDGTTGSVLSTFPGVTAAEDGALSGDYRPSTPWTINTDWQGFIHPVGTGLPVNYGKIAINPKLPFTTAELANIQAQVLAALNVAIPGSPVANSVNDRLDAKVSGVPAAVWNVLTSTMTTAGSIGFKLKNWVLGTDNKAILSANAQAGVVIPTVTTVGSVSGAVGSVTGAVGSVGSTVSATLIPTGLDAITATEPNGKPTTFPGWVMWFIQRFRSSSKTSTQIIVKKEAGATITTQAITDDGLGNETLGAPS